MPVNDFLSGYNQQTQFNQQRAGGDIQNAVGLVGLLKHLQDQQNEAKMRDELQQLGPNPDHAAAIGVVSKYAKPESVLTNFQGEANRRATLDQTKQLRERQFQETADNIQRTLSFKTMELQQKGATAEQIAAATASYRNGLLALKAHAANQYGIKLFDETGNAAALMPAPAPVAPQPQAAPQPAPQMAPQAGPQNVSFQIPPEVQAQRDQIAASIKAREGQPGGGGMIPTANVVPGSAPPPAEPTGPSVVTSNPAQGPVSGICGLKARCVLVVLVAR